MGDAAHEVLERSELTLTRDRKLHRQILAEAARRHAAGLHPLISVRYVEMS